MCLVAKRHIEMKATEGECLKTKEVDCILKKGNHILFLSFFLHPISHNFK